MLILTNGLTDVVDEGFLKVANSLIKRLKADREDIEIVSYERRSSITDTFISVNKFMCNRSVRQVCRRHTDVLYVPFPTKKWVMALRVFLLSCFSKRLRVMLVLQTPMGHAAKWLLRHSGAEIVVFSRDAADFYGAVVGKDRVTYLKTGIDTERFAPVSEAKSREMKKVFGLDADRKLVLHVGHLNGGRNVQQLKALTVDYQVLLVTSTLTKEQQDSDIRKELVDSGVQIIDTYVSNIESIYQMADVYVFPVVEQGHCIDVPLSCMEAAACNKPIVTTYFGEMKEFVNKDGFYFMNEVTPEIVQDTVRRALSAAYTDVRSSVLAYDWREAVCALVNMDTQKG